MDANTFATHMKVLVDAGACIVGECCGTNPEYINQLVQATKTCKLRIPLTGKIRALTSERKTVFIDLEGNFKVVGERINPTGKKALQAELREGKWDIVHQFAEEQIDNGAEILDVNMGMNGIDEKERMLEAIYELTSNVNAPLSIDTSYVDVMEEALRIYPGRALINSIDRKSVV